jgi:transposase
MSHGASGRRTEPNALRARHGTAANGAANCVRSGCASDHVPGPRCPATNRQDGRLTLHRTFRPVLLGQRSVLRCRATTVAGGVLCDLGWKRAVSGTQARCRRCRTSSPDRSSTNRFRNSSLTETQIRSRPLPRLRCRCRRGRRCLPEPPSAPRFRWRLHGELPSASGLD